MSQNLLMNDLKENLVAAYVYSLGNWQWAKIMTLISKDICFEEKEQNRFFLEHQFQAKKRQIILNKFNCLTHPDRSRSLVGRVLKDSKMGKNKGIECWRTKKFLDP